MAQAVGFIAASSEWRLVFGRNPSTRVDGSNNSPQLNTHIILSSRWRKPSGLLLRTVIGAWYLVGNPSTRVDGSNARATQHKHTSSRWRKPSGLLLQAVNGVWYLVGEPVDSRRRLECTRCRFFIVSGSLSRRTRGWRWLGSGGSWHRRGFCAGARR